MKTFEFTGPGFPETSIQIQAETESDARVELLDYLGKCRLPNFTVCELLGETVRVAESDLEAYDPETPVSELPESELEPDVLDFEDALETVPSAAKTEWRVLPDGELAEWLLLHPTISDAAWTDEKRLKGEKRSLFIERLLQTES